VETEGQLKRAYFALKDAGVRIHAVRDHVSQKSVYFHDPDDNLLEIVWERPNTREIFAQGRHDGDRTIEFDRP
jgi:catechol-2,3-dioxygenase